MRLGVDRLHEVAIDRAVNGVTVPVFHKGELVGERRVYNDKLLMFLIGSRGRVSRAPGVVHNMLNDWAATLHALEAGPPAPKALPAPRAKRKAGR